MIQSVTLPEKPCVMSVTPPARDSESVAINRNPQQMFTEQIEVNERTLAGSQTESIGAVKAQERMSENSEKRLTRAVDGL